LKNEGVKLTNFWPPAKNIGATRLFYESQDRKEQERAFFGCIFFVNCMNADGRQQIDLFLL